jgi:hypothetical protein
MLCGMALPAAATAGLRLEFESGGGRTVKAMAEEVSSAMLTVTLAVPAEAIRLAGTTAVSSVALEYVVASVISSHFAVEPGVKFIPEIFSVKSAPPAMTEAGVRLRRSGAAAEAGVAQTNAMDTGKATIRE